MDPRVRDALAVQAAVGGALNRRRLPGRGVARPLVAKAERYDAASRRLAEAWRSIERLLDEIFEQPELSRRDCDQLARDQG
jgi:hypothetical protein